MSHLLERTVQKSEIHAHLLTLASQIVSAHVAHNDTPVAQLPSLIRDIYDTLAGIGDTAMQPDRGHTPRRQPAAQTVPHARDHHRDHGHAPADDYLVCLEDGLTMKMLKRHLLTVHGLTPDQYRAKWDLPDDYPMVAANYAKLRSSLAKKSGLGLRPEARPKRYRS
jgi:predicted transcriptional regulator